MKHVFSFLAGLLGLLAVTTLSAQNWNDTETTEANYFKNIERFYEQWKGDPEEKGKGWKAFKRWEWHWKNRVVLPEGRFPLPTALEAEWARYQKTHALPENKVAANWNSLGPFTSESGYGGIGRINCVAFLPGNPDVLWAGAPAGGLWKSVNGGQTWTTNTDQLSVLGVSAIAIDPTNTNVMYIATGDGDAADTYSTGVLKSVDGGQSWTSTALSFQVTQLMRIRHLLIQPGTPNTLLAATTTGVFISKNAGASWTETVDGNFYDIKYKPDDPTVAYAATRDRIYKSTNAGTTWTLVKTIPTSGRLALAVTPANPNFLYALSSINNPNDADAYAGYNGLYVSTDAGINYTLQSSSPNLLNGSASGSGKGGQGWYDLCLAIDPLNANIVYVGGVNTWKSTNGGLTWTLKTHWTNGGGGGVAITHADKHCMAWQNNTTLFQGNDGGLYKTTNGGNTWTDLSNGLIISQMYTVGLSQSNNSILCGLQDNGTKGLIGGVWDDVGGGDGMECFINPVTPTVMYRSTQRGSLSRSINGGANWSGITPSGESGKGAWITPFTIDPSTPTTIYCAYKSVYKSINQGTNWTKIGSNILSDTNAVFTLLAIAPSNSNTIYAAVSKDIYRTTDGGTVWSKVTGNLLLSSTNITWIAVSPKDPNTVYVTLGNYASGRKVFKSVTGGSTWANISGTLPNLPANTIVFQKDSKEALYVGMDVGVFYRDSAMTDWVPYNTGLPNVPVSDLEIRNSTGKLYAATYGRGLWAADVQTVTFAPTARFTATPSSGTAPLTVQFTDQSDNTPTIWLWDFGNGQQSTAQHPSFTYTEAGIYSVTLTVRNSAGANTVVQTALITVNAPVVVPKAQFTATPTTGTAPLTVQFTDQSDNTPTTWLWDFGNGEQSTAQHPSFTYTEAGTYSVTLTARNSAGADTSVQTALIVVNAPVVVPKAQFTATPTTGTAPLTVQFTDQSDNTPTTWLWDFGNGEQSTAQHPSFTYTEAGTYSVALTVRNSAGADTTVQTALIVVRAPVFTPTANFNGPGNCVDAGASVSFKDVSTNQPEQWYWAFPGGTPNTSTLANPVVTYTLPGTYDVQLVVANAAGADTLIMKEYLSVIAPLVPKTNTDTTVCQGAPLLFEVTGAEGYVWTGPKGSATDQQIQAITSDTGTFAYTVLGTVKNCRTAPLVFNLRVQPSPAITLEALDTLLCQGDTLSLRASGATFYRWADSGGNYTTDSVHYIVPVGSGALLFNVTGSLGNGCEGEGSVSVFVAPPSKVVAMAADTTVCEGQTVFLSASGADFYNWWIDGKVYSAENTVLLSLRESADIVVTGVSLDCESEPDTVHVTVLPLQTMSVSIAETGCPGPSLSYAATVTNGGDQAHIQWYKNGVAQGTGPNFVLNDAVNGDEVYCTVIPDPANCVEPAYLASNIVSVNCLTSAVAVAGSEPILTRIAPNPTTGAFTLLLQAPQRFLATVSIMNPLGQCLETRTQWLPSGEQRLDFDLAPQSAGIYWVKISGNGWVNVIKIVKS